MEMKLETQSFQQQSGCRVEFSSTVHYMLGLVGIGNQKFSISTVAFISCRVELSSTLNHRLRLVGIGRTGSGFYQL